MYERILVPLDGSELAEGVLPYAVEIARKFDSELVLMQAVTPFARLLAETAPGTPETSPTAVEVSADIARQRLEGEIKQAQNYLDSIKTKLQNDGVNTRTHVVEGAAGAAIIDYAREVNASLIAMSTHGRSGLGRLVFGSVADEVLRNSHVPVLVVRPQ